MSVATDLERCLPKPRYAPPSLFDQPFYPNGPYFQDEYLELVTKNRNSETGALNQLAQLRELYKSKLALTNLNSSKNSTKCQSLSLSDVFDNVATDRNEFVSGNCSIYSEPAYRPPEEADSICNTCKKTLTKGETTTDRVIKPHKPPSNNRRNISSLRHPDGASNPNLGEEEKERVPGQ